MFKKIIFIWDANSIHLKKWIAFFVESYEIIILSDNYVLEENYKFWEKNWVEVRDFNVKHKSRVIKFINLLRKFIYYNYFIFTNRDNSIINFHYISLNVLLGIPSVLFIKKRVFTFWWSDYYLANNYIQKIVIKLVWKIAHYITSDTGDILVGLNKKYNIKCEKLNYINHGIERNYFFPTETQEIESCCLKIFSPRALQKFYNHHILFDNIEYIEKELERDIKLIFVDFNADIKYKERLLEVKKKYNKHIILIPTMSQQELWELYRNIDVVISIPYSDGFPVTLIESSFSLKPVIWINKWQYEQVMPNELIIDSYNIEQVIETLKYYLENQKKIITKIREKYKSNFKKFDYKVNMKKMEELYLK